MPPEPSTWDRKDFFKEKKYERLDSVGSVSRWRDSHQGSRDFSRWGSDDFRRPLGHGKQGGYQVFPEETVYRCTPARSIERMVEDESSFRSFSSRGEAKYGRNNQEVRGSISQKDWRGHPRESVSNSVNSFGRYHDLSSQRPVSDLTISHPHSDIENSSSIQHPLKDEHDKMGGSFDGIGTGHVYERDHSLGSIPWKRMKWNRCSSLSSRGSVFSHSNSSRSIRTESDESKSELPRGRMTPVRSPSTDAAGDLPSSTNEETCPRKKQRLGWGQGLAKYEKQKVEAPDEKPDEKSDENAKNTKTSQSIVPSLSDRRSPRLAGLSECSSPPTPSSFACSSSPGLEDKHDMKCDRNDNYTSNFSGSPSYGFQNFVEGFSVIVEHLELTPISNLNCLLSDLLQPEDANSGDSNFLRSTAMNKLLLLKGEFLKAVEKTEFEIDMSENELKMLKSELDKGGPCPTASESLQVKFESKHCEIVNGVQKPTPLQVVSFGDVPPEKTSCDDIMGEGCAEVDDDIDSPGTATSKFVEQSTEKHDDYSDSVDGVGFRSPEVKCLPSVDQKSIVEPCLGDANLVDEMNTIRDFSINLVLKHEDDKLSEAIFASNRNSARNASEVFIKLLATNRPAIGRLESITDLCQQNSLFVKKRILARMHFRRFKERLLTLKYRALQHMWKEDVHLLSVRKHRAKSQKRVESSLRVSHSGHQKNRSSIRTRFTSPGNFSIVPTPNIVDFTSKLLSDSNINVHRRSLKMPALILDVQERRFSRFITSNGLVEDPCSFEKERVMVNPWTPEEKDVFLEKFAAFGKDFKRISSCLSHKTTADCVEFYYKNHKSESFRKIKKMDPRKQVRNVPSDTYLVTSGKKWSREANAVSLDVLGAASMMVSHADDGVKTRHSFLGRSSLLQHCDNKASPSCDFAVVGKLSTSDMFGNEREAVAADVLAGICGAVSSEAVSSCITSSVDPVDGCQDWKYQRKNSADDHHLMVEVKQKIDCQEACSDESCGELDTVDWTDEEKLIFIRACRSYYKNFSKISRCVGTRSKDQCRIFFSKARKSLGLDLIQPGAASEGTLFSDDIGGRSDTEDACGMEIESAICSTQSCTKMDVDLPLSVTKTNDKALEHDRITHVLAEQCMLDENNGSIEQLDHEANEPRNQVSDDCWATVKPELAVNGDVNLEKVTAVVEKVQCNGVLGDASFSCGLPAQGHEVAGFTAKTKTLKEQGISQTVPLNDESACVESTAGPDRPISDAAVELKATPVASCGRLKTESSAELHVRGGGCRQDVKDECGDSGRVTSCIFASDSNTNRNTLVNGTMPSTGFCLTSNFKCQISRDLMASVQASPVISLQQKENLSANLSLRDSSSIHFENHLEQSTSSSALHFVNRQHQRSASADAYPPHLIGHNLPVESSQILRGYPLKGLNKKETNGDAESIVRENHSVVQDIPKVIKDSQTNQFLLEGLYHETCNGLKPPRLSELSLLSRSGHKQTSSDQSRSRSRSSSDTEVCPRRNGDVKLFGQILSHPSPVQSPSPLPNTQKTDSKVEPPKLSGSKPSSDSKLINGHAKDGISLPMKLDAAGNHYGVKEYPMRSYGFWDGNKIQMGFSSLPPDSDILFSKYPTVAFSDFSDTSSCGDQPQQPKRKDQNNGCALVYPSKDINSSSANNCCSSSNSNRGLTDFRSLYRSHDGSNDVMKQQRTNIFPEPQKQNGCEKMPSNFQQQQQGRGGVAGIMNVMGGGGVVVGGGVSDPVAAMKMHYAAATAERYGGGQVGSVRMATREGDSCCRGGEGDIGR